MIFPTQAEFESARQQLVEQISLPTTQVVTSRLISKDKEQADLILEIEHSPQGFVSFIERLRPSMVYETQDFFHFTEVVESALATPAEFDGILLDSQKSEINNLITGLRVDFDKFKQYDGKMRKVTFVSHGRWRIDFVQLPMEVEWAKELEVEVSRAMRAIRSQCESQTPLVQQSGFAKPQTLVDGQHISSKRRPMHAKSSKELEEAREYIIAAAGHLGITITPISATPYDFYDPEAWESDSTDEFYKRLIHEWTAEIWLNQSICNLKGIKASAMKGLLERSQLPVGHLSDQYRVAMKRTMDQNLGEFRQHDGQLGRILFIYRVRDEVHWLDMRAEWYQSLTLKWASLHDEIQDIYDFLVGRWKNMDQPT